ncbi:MAG: hypothetical protein WD671_06840, partial [Parvibaculum sp.]
MSDDQARHRQQGAPPHDCRSRNRLYQRQAGSSRRALLMGGAELLVLGAVLAVAYANGANDS